jgi:hypothetical protein
MTLYDPERDPVRRVGRWIRWSVSFVVVPAVLGVVFSGWIDVRALPLVGPERESAVLLLDGQAYFGHLDDSGESGTLLLRDVYYFEDSKDGPTGLPVGLVKRGSEAHEPADGMRINRDKVLAIEQVGSNSAVAQAVAVERAILRLSPPLSLNREVVAGRQAMDAQRVAAEHDLQRAYQAAIDQLAKLNDLVLPVTKVEAQAITKNAAVDLHTVRRNALAAIATTSGMSPADAQGYVVATDPLLEGQTFANEPGVLLAPALDAVVKSYTKLYAQVGDNYAKQLTQPRTATPSPSPTPTPRP